VSLGGLGGLDRGRQDMHQREAQRDGHCLGSGIGPLKGTTGQFGSTCLHGSLGTAFRVS
jgi:hypothetical protein